MNRFEGKLIAIRVSSDAALPMDSVDQIDAIAGEGLRGDRYAILKGAFQRDKILRSQQVTLIEQEAITAAAKDYDLDVDHALSRRNLLTGGVPLNHLVGVEFCVGAVRMRGVKLCEPCEYLEKHSGAGLLKALRHRGGLRAEVVSDGVLTVGDAISPMPSE